MRLRSVSLNSDAMEAVRGLLVAWGTRIISEGFE